MSRYCGDRDSTALLVAGEHWRDSCLLSEGGSVFTSGDIWRVDNFEHLVVHYVYNLDEGEGNFFGKLEKQLAAAPSEAKLLCAELMWLLLLCPSNIKPPKKRENVMQIASLAGVELSAEHPMLSDASLAGIGSAGTAYNNLRWRELVYAINLFLALYSKSLADRRELLADRSTFADWLEGIEGNEKRQFRHMLMFMLFPDNSERIFGASDRRGLLAAFRGENPRAYLDLTAQQIDAEIMQLRVEQEAMYVGVDLDWYVPPLKAFWRETSKAAEHESGMSFVPVLERFIEQSRTQDLTTKSYPSSFAEHMVRVSFGAGNQAHVTWLAFLGPGQTPTKGIYPVYLYFKADNRLVFSRGISASNTPVLEWQAEDPVTINEFFLDEFGHKAIRYGECLMFASYDLAEELDAEQIDSDLITLLTEYDDLLDFSPVAVSSDPQLNDYPQSEVPSQDGVTEPLMPYGIDNALREIYIPEAQAKQIISLLETKKNVVLQGPPGTGKSFASKRLAYALMGTKDPTRVEMVQFHQSYAYEDFVQGYRPSDSGFELQDGNFHQFCKRAISDPENRYVFIIDEINRGNLSKIFGELMLLIEADKRGPEWQIPLAYAKNIDLKFYIPENLYIIGLMNTADRSLAMVDFALRRRFAFFDLKPQVGSEAFQRDLKERGVEDAMISKIDSRIGALNNRIAGDTLNLGPGFCIGHSFFCGPSPNGVYDDLWFEQIVRFELEPLIREYWFDEPQTADAIVGELLA